MLTAAATIEDRVDGLGLGADDYLPKPFAFAELVARLRALLRRAQPPHAPVLEHGDLRLDPAQRSASRAGLPLDLGPKEFGVAGAAARRAGAGVSAEELLERVWGRDGGPVYERGQGDGQPAPPQARRPSGHRDAGPGRLPDRG